MALSPVTILLGLPTLEVSPKFQDQETIGSLTSVKLLSMPKTFNGAHPLLGVIDTWALGGTIRIKEGKNTLSRQPATEV